MSLSSLYEIAIPLGEDRRLATGELVGRHHLADRQVQPRVIVICDEAGGERTGFVDRQRHVPQTIAFERARRSSLPFDCG